MASRKKGGKGQLKIFDERFFIWMHIFLSAERDNHWQRNVARHNLMPYRKKMLMMRGNTEDTSSILKEAASIITGQRTRIEKWSVVLFMRECDRV